MKAIEYDYICSSLTEDEILCQIAEEAAELAQAALKLIRAKKQTNATPVTVSEAKDNLLEEMADVQVATGVFKNMFRIGDSAINYIADKKIGRWVSRLSERSKG